jgi:hypothetical protein
LAGPSTRPKGLSNAELTTAEHCTERSEGRRAHLAPFGKRHIVGGVRLHLSACLPTPLSPPISPHAHPCRGGFVSGAQGKAKRAKGLHAMRGFEKEHATCLN